SVSESGQRVPFVVMEILAGRSLEQQLKQGTVTTASALRICAQVASALAAAHARGLAHRDVKPANVMLTRSGAQVVDFGLAVVVDLVGRCLAKAPADRPTSAEVATILAQAAGITVPLDDGTDDELDRPDQPGAAPAPGPTSVPSVPSVGSPVAVGSVPGGPW